MANKEKHKLEKAPTKQAHFECEVALYEKFEAYCHKNGKNVSNALRAYIKMCVGE